MSNLQSVCCLSFVPVYSVLIFASPLENVGWSSHILVINCFWCREWINCQSNAAWFFTRFEGFACKMWLDCCPIWPAERMYVAVSLRSMQCYYWFVAVVCSCWSVLCIVYSLSVVEWCWKKHQAKSVKHSVSSSREWATVCNVTWYQNFDVRHILKNFQVKLCHTRNCWICHNANMCVNVEQ